MRKTEAIKLSQNHIEINYDETLVSKQFVSWGKKNDAPQRLIDLFKQSATHQGIINSKVSYIMSDGFKIVEGNEAEILSFLNNGISDYDLEEVFNHCALDLELFNAFAVIGVWNREGTRPAYIEHIDFDSLRPNEEETIWYYSDDWTQLRQSEEKTNLKAYPVIDTARRSGEFIFVIKVPSKKSKGQQGIFPTPPYSGGINAIETEIETSIYHLNEIRNGFAGGTIINILDSEPTTEEEVQSAKNFKKLVTGASKAGEVVLHYHDTPEGKLEVINLSGNDLDKRYLMLEENVRDTIIRAHSITNPILFGIKTEGQLGGATEMEISFEIFKTTYVKYRQKFINTAINWLMRDVFGIVGRLELEEVKLPFQTERVEPRQEFELSKENKELDQVISEFAKYGIKADELKVYDKYEVPINESDYGKFEADTLEGIFNDVMGITTQNKSVNIMELIDRGERLIDIAKALNMKTADVLGIVKKLQNDGFLDGLKLTAKGNKILDISKVEVDDFEVRYTYELRQGIEGDKVIPTTRDFCRELIALNRAYTREEIDKIGDAVGWNVFQLRGGWYHNPKTNQTTPFCRHAWQFILVKKQ